MLATQAGVADPESSETFARCKLDLGERETHAEAMALHRDLLKLRREDPVFRAQGAGWLDGTVLGRQAFALRFFGETAGDRLLLVNLGMDLELEPVPEPLLAPLTGLRWGTSVVERRPEIRRQRCAAARGRRRVLAAPRPGGRGAGLGAPGRGCLPPGRPSSPRPSSPSLPPVRREKREWLV